MEAMDLPRFGPPSKGFAKRIGVDACTLARWERGERGPTGGFAARALLFLNTAEAAWGGDTARTA